MRLTQVLVPQKKCWFSRASLLMSARDRTLKLTRNPLIVRPLITSNFKTCPFLLNPTWHRSFYPACAFILQTKSDTFGNKTEAGWEHVVRSGWIGEHAALSGSDALKTLGGAAGHLSLQWAAVMKQEHAGSALLCQNKPLGPKCFRRET